MKEKIKLIVLIIIFVIVLVVTNNLLKETEKTQNIKENEITNKIEENVTTTVVSSYNKNESEEVYTDIVEEEQIGKVIEITENDFEKEVLNAEKRVLVDLYADWCSPCKKLSPILEEIAKENLDLKVVKVDVDENSNLASQYGVYYIPLLVVIENGEKIDSAVGALSKNDILELVK